MRAASPLLGLFSLLLFGCTEEKNEHAVLLVGPQSFPDYESVELGVDLIVNDKQLSVGGDGHLADDEWGALKYRYTNGESHTFRKGGVVAWSPPGENFEEISGKAQVVLFAYLLDAKAGDDLTPSSMVVRKKWRIPEGPFNLKIK